jgi:hypothetical protein
LIATHIVDCLADEHPNDAWKVKAYEGVQKGAIGIR